VETLGDAAISIDRNGRALLWNDAAEKAFGYSRKESVGAQLADLNILNNPATGFGPAMQPLKGTRARQRICNARRPGKGVSSLSAFSLDG
jgi:PAS domain-containing protein